MATANIRAVITAEDKASGVVKSFSSGVEKSSDKIVKSNQSSANSYAALLAVVAGTGIATHKLVGVLGDTIDAANKEQAALTGLSSITRAFKVDTDKATRAAEDLAKDGLMTVTDAATGLKNLIAAGFNLDQAVTLMKRFKDSAAFGRQSALSFGQAVTSATEGIKNGNSILVDNAGVTKNLSVILEEAGFSAQDLMRATTDANVRQALFNGIIKETNAQVGDAARLTELFGGKQAQLSAKTTELKARIGEALQPALANLLQTITPLIERFAKFAESHPTIVAGILLATTAVTGLIFVLGSLGLAIMGLSPILGAFTAASTASIGIVSTAFSGLAALIASPIVMPAIAVGAALFALFQVRDAAFEAWDAVRNTKNAVEGLEQSNKAVEARLRAGLLSNDPNVRTRSANALKGLGFRAEGGPVMANSPYIVGERGPELFVPKNAGTVVPNHQMSGPPINLSVNVGVYTGSEIEKRKLAQELLKSLQDVAGMQGKSVAQMLGS